VRPAEKNARLVVATTVAIILLLLRDIAFWLARNLQNFGLICFFQVWDGRNKCYPKDRASRFVRKCKHARDSEFYSLQGRAFSVLCRVLTDSRSHSAVSPMTSRGLFLWEGIRHGLNLTNDFHLVPSLVFVAMTLLPLSHMSLWSGV
jgi:hypothetical protein